MMVKRFYPVSLSAQEVEVLETAHDGLGELIIALTLLLLGRDASKADALVATMRKASEAGLSARSMLNAAQAAQAPTDETYNT